MPALSPTPTDNAIGKRVGDFATLTNALNYAAAGVGGMNFYTARGVLADVISWAQMREDALAVAGRLLARGLQPGDRVAIVAETEADFSRAMMGSLYWYGVEFGLIRFRREGEVEMQHLRSE